MNLANHWNVSWSAVYMCFFICLKYMYSTLISFNEFFLFTIQFLIGWCFELISGSDFGWNHFSSLLFIWYSFAVVFPLFHWFLLFTFGKLWWLISVKFGSFLYFYEKRDQIIIFLSAWTDVCSHQFTESSITSLHFWSDWCVSISCFMAIFYFDSFVFNQFVCCGLLKIWIDKDG
jgi:hypothetical protein